VINLEEHEMKKHRTGALVLASTIGAAPAVMASQPPDVVTSDSAGNTAMRSFALDLLTSGQYNTAVGGEALGTTSSGSTNTAVGLNALYFNTTGGANSTVGLNALSNNTSGIWNSAFGELALVYSTTGSYDTATGANALVNEWMGDFNTVNGAQVDCGFGCHPNSGGYNTSLGSQALPSDTTGGGNTAVGANVLVNSRTAFNNSAFGSYSLLGNSSGAQNIGLGAYSLQLNTVGANNVAAGYQALYGNTKGSNNVALGRDAGYNLTSGSNNIDISNEGLAGDNDTIKIGAASTQTKTYIAGIENSKVTGAAVYVTASGQLGVLASSARYKTAIAPMGTRTHDLDRLRPVTFHLKNDPRGTVQNGLIAEEVAKIYPELVIRDAAGRIQGVRYDELAPMLLNEVQQQQAQLDAMEQQVADLTQVLQVAIRQKRNHST
jgi:hypothetical protein